MKIANVVCTYPPYKGGIGTAALDFSQLVSKKGFEVTTFVPDHGLDIDREQDKKDRVVRIKPLLRLGNGAFLPKLFFHLKDFDIIYLHYPFFGGAEVVWLFKLLHPKKKVIIRYHMDVVGLPPLARILSLPSKLIEISLFKQADLLLSASLDYVKNGSLGSFYRKYEEKFKEVPYGVDIKRFKPDKKDHKKMKILFVGGLDQAHYFKGVANLIEAVFELDQAGIKDWELNIAGSGDLKQEYEQRVKNLGIENKVFFLGKVSDEDLPRVYAENDLTVLPSINKGEAFGIVLIESMASATPVIASDLAGVRSVFENGRQGLLVKPGDVLGLKNALKILAQDRGFLEEMSKNARQLAQNKYSKDKIGDDLSNILQNI